MTWVTMLVLAAGVWAQRVFGMFVGARVVARQPALARLATLIPAAVVTAVIVQLTIADGRSYQLDASAVGLGVAAVLVWRRAPFVAVVIAAAATTAIVRAFA